MATKKKFYGPWIVAGSFVLQFCCYGIWIYTFPVFLPAMCEDMGWSRGDVAMALTLSTLLARLLFPVIGKITPKVGVRIILTFGCLVAAIGFILLSTLTTLWQFYLFYSLILTLGLASISVVPNSIAILNWYVKRRSSLLGITSAGSAVGGIVMVLVVQTFINSYGWSNAYLFLAGIFVMVAAPIAAFVMRTRPQDMGQLPDGDLPKKVNESARKEDSISTAPTFMVGQALRTSAFWLLASTRFLWGLGYGAVIAHIVAFAMDIGLSAIVASGGVGFLCAFSIAGRLGFGWLGDRIDKRYVLMMAMASGLLSLILLMLTKTELLLYVSILFLGLSAGAFIPVNAAILAEYFGAKEFGTLYGLNLLTGGLGMVIAPSVAGYIFDFTGSYHIAFTIGAVAMAGGIVLYFLAKPPKL